MVHDSLAVDSADTSIKHILACDSINSLHNNQQWRFLYKGTVTER